MRPHTAMFAAAITLSVSASASADDFDQRWMAVLDGVTACVLHADPDRTETSADNPYAGACAEIHRLYEAMRPVADKRNHDAEQRSEMEEQRSTIERLQKDLRTAQRQK